MKTQQIMERPFLDGVIRQNHKTQMMCLTDFESIGNAYRRKANLSDKQLTQYFKNKEADEYITQVSLETGIPEDELVTRTRGRNGGTWVHPYIFVDVVMWFSPEFKVRVIKWFHDNLLGVRDDSGESFKEMMATLTRAYPKPMTDQLMYPRIARLIAKACDVEHLGEKKWNKATEEQLKLRDKIHENIILLSEVAPELGTCVNKAINMAIVKFADLI